jgi:hypothetical protein
LEALADAADIGYVRHALLADSLSPTPHTLINTIAVVSADAEADIVSLTGRFGGGTIDELRSVLNIPNTPKIVEAIKPWRSKVDKTRSSVGVELRNLGFAEKYVSQITAADRENLFFTVESLITALDALNPFQDRTTMINGEAYVLIS